MVTVTQLTGTTAVARIMVDGCFDAHQATRVQEEINGALARDTRFLVFDLSEVTSVDSAALATLVRAAKLCHERAGEVILCGIRQPVRVVFELTRLDGTFRIFEDADAAWNSLSMS